MVATSYKRGHLILWDGYNWRYADNNSLINVERPCKKCGKLPTSEGYDACLGYIPGAISACCGHGIEKGYIFKKIVKYFLSKYN